METIQTMPAGQFLYQFALVAAVFFVCAIFAGGVCVLAEWVDQMIWRSRNHAERLDGGTHG